MSKTVDSEHRTKHYKDMIEPKLKDIEKWCDEGAIDVEIAKRLGISVKTLYEYKKYSEFLQAIKKGKENADYKVENSLYKRAMGYRVLEKTIIRNADGEIIKEQIQEKHIAPDTTAQIFWLKNRMRENWNDKQQIDLNVINVNIPGITDKEPDNPDN